MAPGWWRSARTGTAGARKCSWRRNSRANALSWDAGWRSPNGASGSWWPGWRYLARVHNHPVAAFHSRTDDANPALSHEGAISIVVPYFGLGLRRGLAACAVYRLTAGTRPVSPKAANVRL